MRAKHETHFGCAPLFGKHPNSETPIPAAELLPMWSNFAHICEKGALISHERPKNHGRMTRNSLFIHYH